MKNFFSKKYTWVIFVVFLGLNVFLLGLFLQGRYAVQELPNQTNQFRSDTERLQASGFKSFREFSDYFIDIAEEKGGAYAFEILKIAPLPTDIDTHLLGHVVGDILYKQEGLAGINVCTHDFRNACSHTIVIGLFFEQGEDALEQIAEACYRAPGGLGAYTMCFHGLGHGVLAYSGYDLEKAVNLCKKTGTSPYNHEESNQCISGTIMEIISGVHDPELWAKQRPKYFRENDPLYPCSADFIPQNAKYLCYLYLTPHLFEAVAGDTRIPKAEAFPFCDNIPLSDSGSRDACYGGFGKEFVGFIANRDIRTSSIENITEDQLREVYKLCVLANNKEGASSCIRGATNSLYWGGENDRGAATRFCAIMPDPYYQKACFANLVGAVNHYIEDPAYKREFCEEVPDMYRNECVERLQ